METQADTRRDFKKGIDGDIARRRRDDEGVQLRKNKRLEQIQKRRMGTQGNFTKGGETASPPSSRDPDVLRKLQKLPELVIAIRSQDPNVQLEATTALRQLLSLARNPPIQEVIDSGVVPRLVEFLDSSEYPFLMFEAAWALTNIASGTSVHTQAVVESGATPKLIQLLQNPHADVREQAIWALGNIAGDSPHCRDMVLQMGGLAPLLQICASETKISVLKNVTWTLSNLCRGKPQPDFNAISPCLTVLANLVYNEDSEVVTDACWALSYISDDNLPGNIKIQAVIRSGVVPRLVQLLMSPSNQVKTPALRAIGNIVTGNDLQTQMVINSGGLEGLSALLSNEKKGIRKEACWTLSNITAGTVDQIQAVIAAGIFPKLIEILSNSEFDVQKEASWAISNACSGGTPEQIRALVSMACIGPLCALFDCNDAKVVIVAMEGIEKILKVGESDAESMGNGVNMYAQYVEECGGLDKLEAAQHHENIKVYEKASSLLRLYFDADEYTDAALEPGVNRDDSGYAFGAQAPSGGFQF